MGNAEEAVVADTLDNLVQQFSQELCFYRELIQNAMDAGSHQVEVKLEYDTARQMAIAHVIDGGEGMDRHIIDTQLTRLFSSSKDQDYTKIGKFGIGFVSVFAVKPEAVVVDTARNGENWRILFNSQRQFERIALDQPVEGTHVQVYIAMPPAEYKKFVRNSERTVRYWCRHAQAEIRFQGKPINEPFEVPSPIKVHYAEAGTEVVAGLSAKRAPFFGFYNQGLTLLEGHKKIVPGVAFKIKSRYLEHTLTRDNVMQDQNYDKAMKILNRVIGSALMQEMFRYLRGAAHQGDAAALVRLLPMIKPHLAAAWPAVGMEVPVLRRLDGAVCSLAQLAENARRFRDYLKKLNIVVDSRAVPCDEQRTPVSETLQQAGVWVLDRAWVEPLRQELGILGYGVFPLQQFLAAPVQLTPTDVSAGMQALADATRRLLLGVGVRFGEVAYHRFSYPQSPVADRVFLIRPKGSSLVPSAAAAALGEDEAPRGWTLALVARGDLLLNVDHPLTMRLVRLQMVDTASAAYMLAKVVRLADGVHPATESRLLQGFVEVRAAVGDDLLRDLRSVGHRDSEGTFTLDTRKAQEKMQEFQLVDPHHYILCFIQAAVALQARHIRIQVDAATMYLEVAACQVDAEFLKQPLAGLFISQKRVDLEGLRQLSIGLNAALSLQPSVIEVRHGTTVVRLRSAQDIEVATERRSQSFFSILVSERWSWKLASRAVQTVLGKVPEVAAVREKACWCPVPLQLNGNSVSDDIHRAAGEDMLAQFSFQASVPGENANDGAAPGTPDVATAMRRRDFVLGGPSPHTSAMPVHGLLWVGKEPLHYSVLSLVKHGVEVRQKQLDLPPLQAHGVVHLDDLLTNASGSDMVEDKAFQAVVDAVGEATLELFFQLCRDYRTAPPKHELLRSFLLRFYFITSKWSGLRGQAMLATLRRLKMFRLIDGEAIDVEAVLEQIGAEDHVLCHDGPLPEAPLPGQLVLDVPRDELVILQRLLGKRLVPITEGNTQLQREHNQRQWARSAEESPRLPTGGSYLEVLSFQEERCSGEIGVPRTITEGGARIAFFMQNRLVVRKTVEVHHLIFDAAINYDLFNPNSAWDGIAPDGPYLVALKLLVKKYLEACDRLAASHGSGHSDAPVVRCHVLRMLHCCSQLSTRLADVWPAILCYPVFRTVADRYASLADLERDKQEFGWVFFVCGVAPGAQGDHRQIVMADADTQFGFTDGDLLTVLAHFFGTPKEYGTELLAERERYKGRLPCLAGVALLPVELITERYEVAVGMALPVPRPAAPTAARVQQQGGLPLPPPRKKLDATGGGHMPLSTVRWFRDGEQPHGRTCPLEVGPLQAAVRLLTPSPVVAEAGILPQGPLPIVAEASRLREAPQATEDDEKDYCEAVAAVHDAVTTLAQQASQSALPRDWQRDAVYTFLLQFVAWKKRELSPQVAAVRLFPVREWMYSLASAAEVLADLDAYQYLHVLHAETTTETVGERPVFMLTDARARAALEALVGSANMRDYAPVLQQREAQRAFLRQPRELPELRRDAYLAVAEVGDGFQGQVGLLSWTLGFHDKSTIRVLHQERHLCDLAVETDVPLEGVVSGVEPDSTWKMPATDEVRRRLAGAVQRAANAALRRLAHQEKVTLAARHLLLWHTLRGANAARIQQFDSDDLRDVVADKLLFEDSSGEPMSLRQVVDLYAHGGRLRWVPPEVSGRPRAGQVVRLSPQDLHLLRPVCEKCVDYRVPLLTENMSHPATPRKLRLLPDGPYVARLRVGVLDMTGELAVTMGEPRGVKLFQGERVYQTAELFGELPVVGVLESATFILPPENKIVLTGNQRQALDHTLDSLFVQVARQANDNAMALSCLLDFYLYRQVEMAGQWLAELYPPLFNWGDDKVSLLDLRDYVKTHGSLTACVGTPWGSEPCLVVEKDSSTQAFLDRFFGARVNWKAAAPPVITKPVAAAAEPVPDLESTPTTPIVAEVWGEGPPRTKLRLRDSVVPSSTPDPALAQNPDEQLLARIRDCFEALPSSQRLDYPGFHHYPAMAVLSDAHQIALCDGRRVLLNRSHALVRQARSADPALIAVLASAVFSCANQAREEITDKHELHFLADLADWLDARLRQSTGTAS